MNNSANIIEAIEYAREFQGQTFVIKVGGDLFENTAKTMDFLKDVHHMRTVIDAQVILVHGAGPQTNNELSKSGILVKKDPATSLRITDRDTLSCVDFAQSWVNDTITTFLGDIQCEDGKEHYDVVGRPLSKHIIGVKQSSNADLGFVGEITNIDESYLLGVLSEGCMPVINSMGVDENGQQYNINADHVAEAIAIAIDADHLIMVTHSGGLYKNFGKPNQELISEIDIDGIEDMLKTTHDLDGMRPKLEGVLSVLKAPHQSDKVRKIQFTSAEGMINEVFTKEGTGTMIVKNLDRPDVIASKPEWDTIQTIKHEG